MAMVAATSASGSGVDPAASGAALHGWGISGRSKKLDGFVPQSIEFFNFFDNLFTLKKGYFNHMTAVVMS
jgi:hypothetical protein